MFKVKLMWVKYTNHAVNPTFEQIEATDRHDKVQTFVESDVKTQGSVLLISNFYSPDSH